jgi:hypothetical protein
MKKTQQKITEAKRTEAKEGFEKCFELLQCFMPLDNWKASVNPEVAQYAIKRFGSLEAMYFDSQSEICNLALYCYDVWQGVANPTYGRPEAA